MEPILTNEQAAAKEGKKICAICEKKINKEAVKSAEFSATDGEFYAKGVPEGHESTGWYDIGAGCYAKKVIK